MKRDVLLKKNVARQVPDNAFFCFLRKTVSERLKC